MSKFNNILVDGGLGYIGNQLIRDLATQYKDARITILDKNFDARSLRGLEKGRYSFVQGDITNIKDVMKVSEGKDLVFHLAALVGAESSNECADEMWRVNYAGAVNVINANPTARIVFPSTANVYGSEDRLGLDETIVPKPIFPYASSKLAVEKYLVDNDGDFRIGRLSTNFGWSEGVRFNLVINTMIKNALLGQPIYVHGSGQTWRPFIHVRDTSQSLIKLAELENEGLDLNAYPNIYNIGAMNMQIKDVAFAVRDEIAKIGKTVEVKFEPHKVVPFSYNLSFEKAKRAGIQPKLGIDIAVKEMVTNLEGIL